MNIEVVKLVSGETIVCDLQSWVFTLQAYMWISEVDMDWYMQIYQKSKV